MPAELIQIASPERATAEEIAREHRELTDKALVQQLLDSTPEPIVVLNRHRQVVLVNDKLTALLGETREALLGRRPGEIFHCIHSENEGCGTTEFCRECGAFQAICESQRSNSAQSRECRMTCAGSGGDFARDMRVWATPLASCGEFTVFAVRDTSDEKRRLVLERLFFHDVLNAAGGLRGVMDVLPETDGEQRAEMFGIACALADDLVEQVLAQRDLLSAERGDLSPTFEEIDVEEMLSKLTVSYRHHPVAAQKIVAMPKSSGDKKIHSDETLLSRVLGNLIKNALEASAMGQTVTVAFENFGKPVFSVHNEGAMPRSIQLQLFQRSFSTKTGSGRGLGTYSVKLLTEQYLHGKVAFTSSAAGGTTFTISLGGT